MFCGKLGVPKIAKTNSSGTELQWWCAIRVPMNQPEYFKSQMTQFLKGGVSNEAVFLGGSGYR